jgi:hypothetical protein
MAVRTNDHDGPTHTYFGSGVSFRAGGFVCLLDADHAPDAIGSTARQQAGSFPCNRLVSRPASALVQFEIS